jgi:(p)ppGpp synthase/HD superfamily hydrolase
MSSPSLRFEEALVFAARLHREQRRKGGDVPYVSHLLGVAAIVLEYGGDEDEAIAALLHDAIEDQGGVVVWRKIQERFGDRVAYIVHQCSDTDQTPKPPWQARKEAFLARLAETIPSALLVIAADKLHNARSLIADYRSCGDRLWIRFSGGRDGTLWYYRAVVETLKGATPGPLVQELARAVTELEQLARSRSEPMADSRADASTQN